MAVMANTQAISWNGAQWIGSPELSLDAARRGVFGLEAAFSGSGGIVFGAGDERLAVARRNVQGQAGISWISYYLDASASPAQMIIHRVNYAEGDSADIPFATVEVGGGVDPAGEHTLTIEVMGNMAAAYLDGRLVDGEMKSPFPGAPAVLAGRQLNPLGNNDVITFPRLNKIGLLAGGRYRCMRVFDLRPPRAEVFRAEAGDCLSLVGALKDPSHGGVPVLRRVVALAGEVLAAKLYATARGTYSGIVNGQALNADGSNSGPHSKDYFTPGASQFDKHIFYHVYDVTRLLQAGENTMEFTLGSGWWSDSQGFVVSNYNFWGNNPALKMKLEIEYADGAVETVVSDTDWLASTNGPIRYGSHFHGETYDARREDMADGWQAAVVVEPVIIEGSTGFASSPDLNAAEPEYAEHPGNPVGEAAALTARAVTAIDGGFIYDMGQNMAGVPRIKVRGAAGQAITLRFGEALYPNLPEYGALQGFLLTENLRDADCTDVYICKGDPAGEVIFPRLTFHGYRYLELSGLDAAPALEDVEGVALSSITAWTGGFECSDPLVNKLFQNIQWSQRANFISIPTDCPQRNERMGWMGDAQVFAETAAYNADVLAFLRRYLLSARDLQREDGRFPNIAPFDGGFGGIPWESAGIIIPWTLYRQYCDKRVLEENYAAMARYIEYLRRNSTGHLLNPGVGVLGDWLAADMSTDDALTWNAICAYDVRIVADTAKVLGDMATFGELDRLFGEIRAVWNRAFVDPSTGKTRRVGGELNDTQASYALPLYYGIFNDSAQAAMLLNEKTLSVGCALTTGFLGTQCIASALSDHGYVETAYKLLRQTAYPSWLCPVAQGATTVWERWDSCTQERGFGGNNSMNSFNHYSLGAVGAWLYSRALGIRPGAEGGYKEFTLQPCFGGLDWVKGHYDTSYGRIASAWQKTESGHRFAVEIPASTRAHVALPGRPPFVLYAGRHEFSVPS
jgi:alpha-L-rhamnosidase